MLEAQWMLPVSKKKKKKKKEVGDVASGSDELSLPPLLRTPRTRCRVPALDSGTGGGGSQIRREAKIEGTGLGWKWNPLTLKTSCFCPKRKVPGPTGSR